MIKNTNNENEKEKIYLTKGNLRNEIHRTFVPFKLNSPIHKLSILPRRVVQEPSPTYIPADTSREVSHLVPGNLLGIKLFLGREYVCEFHKCWSPEGLAYCFAPVVWPSWRAGKLTIKL